MSEGCKNCAWNEFKALFAAIKERDEQIHWLMEKLIQAEQKLNKMESEKHNSELTKELYGNLKQLKK